MNNELINSSLKESGGILLIADSGSTKVDWTVSENGKILQQIFTKGINPFYQSEEEISQEIETALVPKLKYNNFESIHFYGAGCIFDKVDVVKRAIQQNFRNASKIEVNSDVLAAARSLCNHEGGIACIMGTGSNSCYYNGKTIEKNVSPLGYILGDEGSGAVLGKTLVSDVLKNQLSEELKNKFFEKYNLTPAEIIDKVYRKPFPNRFLASLTPFLSENISEPAILSLVKKGFDSFVKRNLLQYNGCKTLPIHFVGSIAFYFQDVLKEVIQENGLTLGKISQNPMAGLIEYHNTEK